MRHRNKVFTITKLVRYFIYITLIIMIVFGTLFALAGLKIMSQVDAIDPRIVNMDLNETSIIYDQDGNLIEKIATAEYRTMIGIQDMPKNLTNAFIAIEDERFRDHVGIDPHGILASLYQAYKTGDNARGASTITQQLVKNTFLTPARTLERKLKEAEISIQLEKMLTKDQILEAYLNRVSMGQNAYGVEEAAQTYFNKHAKDLDVVECAMLASIVKNPNTYPPFYRVAPNNFDQNTMEKVGTIDILGQTYMLVFNPENENRANAVLRKMHELEMITDSEYETAKKVDKKSLLKPAEKKQNQITNYFADYVKDRVVEDLQDKYGWTKSRAQDELFYGGLKIYSTIDMKLQKQVEEDYKKFNEILVGDTTKLKAPLLLDMTLDQYGNIIDSNGKLVFLNKANVISTDSRIYLTQDEFKFADNGDLMIKSVKMIPYQSNIDVMDYFTIDNSKNLQTHTIGSLPIKKDDFNVDNGWIRINKSALDENKKLFEIKDNVLYFNEGQIFINKDGVVQPQSASIIIDYKNGHIVAMAGGRDVDGRRIFNRATNSQRQPGSAIKPIGVYLEALDKGFTAATPIDDVPMTLNGSPWPNNWYSGYKGITSLRYAVEQSINTSAVTTLNAIGARNVIPYLEKMNIIDKAHPDRDTFVTKEENEKYNDENASALALGGMTKGLSPLRLASAYSAIANDGKFINPSPYTKVIDNDGKVLLEFKPEPIQVVSPQTAYIMKDILRTVVTNGLGKAAQVPNQVTAGKTGTTQYTADLWFVGFTDYYLGATWIGSDTPRITMNKNSMIAAQMWQNIMTKAHEGKEPVSAFNRPDGIIKSSVCTISGKLPGEFCSQDPRGVVKTEIFVKGTEPKQVCDLHVSAEICEESGKLANEFCPEDKKVMKVFVQRKPAYNPEMHGGIMPADWVYELPTETCDIHNAETVDEEESPEIFNPDVENPNLIEEFPHHKPGNNEDNEGGDNENPPEDIELPPPTPPRDNSSVDLFE
ncbi:MAG: PBP1A family penicillin-binding protein [Ezakiella sp.]|nr:PBP1A family penicillin-binding protein [Ezakiella sp.]MDD7472252.1 PBP1A family penicillin-binding protein [Bacillota bacterium]MDY3923747.1 PBP1A family penicillin-binding protein [Ezakiella sp.]